MSDTAPDKATETVQPYSDEEIEQLIGDKLREANRLVSEVSSFGYPVPAMMFYLEPKQPEEIPLVVTGDAPPERLKMELDLVIASPALTLVAYVKQQEANGLLISPEQKDTLRDELTLLGKVMDNIRGIVDRRLEWLGPKEEPSLIVQNVR